MVISGCCAGHVGAMPTAGAGISTSVASLWGKPFRQFLQPSSPCTVIESLHKRSLPCYERARRQPSGNQQRTDANGTADDCQLDHGINIHVHHRAS